MRPLRLVPKRDGEDDGEDEEQPGDVPGVADVEPGAAQPPGREGRNQIHESRGRAIASGTAASAK